MQKIKYLLAVTLLLAGCSQSPMDKLHSDKIYPDMNETYWATQQKQNPQLWNEALSYCSSASAANKPNCAAVGHALMCGGDCDKKAPAIGHSGESVHFDS